MDLRVSAILLLMVISQAQCRDSQIAGNNDMRLVVLVNGIAILPCGTSNDILPSVQYSWTKGDIPVITEIDDRMFITDDGHLVIKNTIELDSGIYSCQATSDDLTVEVNVTLLVIVPDTKPYFFNFSQPFAAFKRLEGASVKLVCPVRGHPTPGISWLKDDKDFDASRVDSTIRTEQYSITLNNLKVSDSGNYTCLVSNDLGSVKATYALVVTPKTHIENTTRPDMSLFHPLNTTVKFGSSATFQCRVRSEAPPNIQWLKRVEEFEMDVIKKQHIDIIKVNGENYRVLQSSEVIERSDGSFLNKLTIPEVFEADSGKYICLGANSMGYSYRSAYLTVLPRPRALPLGWSRSVAMHPGHPSSLLVAIPITLGIVVGVMVALVVLCHRRRLDTSVPLQPSGYRKDGRLLAKSSVLDTLKEEGPDSDLEDYKEGQAYISRLQSEAELEGSGNVVTKLCMEANTSSYEGCFVMRNEV